METCGLDEAGRGPLAGPLVAAAVILKTKVEGLNDSKKLSPRSREILYKKIVRSGALMVTETISVRSINSRGMGWASKEIFKRLIRKTEAQKYIVDGNLHPGKVKGKTNRIRPVVKADATRKCVMAASIVAKTVRDKIMMELDSEYPQYGWRVNKGYGTQKHIKAIERYGEVKYHRSVYVTSALRNKSAFI